MAKITPGPNVQDIRGSVKNVVYSIWKAGVHYVRSKAAIIANPQSEDQASVRNLFASSSIRWQNNLTSEQRAGWEEMAQRMRGLAFPNGQGGILNITPDTGGIMSGQNTYVGFRTASFTAGTLGLFTDDAPLQGPAPAAPRSLAASYNTVTNILTVTWIDPAQTADDARVRIWVRSREVVYHRQLLTSEALEVETIDLTSAKGANGASILFAAVEPLQLLVQMDTVNPSGFRSKGSSTVEVRLAA